MTDLSTEEDEQTWTHIDLGFDDCETCGGNSNSITWFFHVGRNEIELSASTGCYGSDRLATGDPEEAAAFIRRHAKGFPEYRKRLNKAASRLVATVNDTRARALST